MSDKTTPLKNALLVDEDTIIKMKAKLFWAIIVAVVIGTFYFATVMFRLNVIDSRFEMQDKKTNYLFRKLKIDNPFTGDVVDVTSPSASVTVVPP